MLSRVVLLLVVVTLLSCRGRKDMVYSWQGDGESRTLTLLKNGTFILDIKAGYYNRTDTGQYRINGDTLLINPDKVSNHIDSLVTADSLFQGQRYMEVFEEEVVFNTQNEVEETFYRQVVFPSVVINDSLALALSPDDPAYHKLVIPESIHLKSLKVTVSEDNTCKPSVTYSMTVPDDFDNAGSYRVYLKSRENKHNYLAGFKWLIRGNTIQPFFRDNNCEPAEIKLIRR